MKGKRLRQLQLFRHADRFGIMPQCTNCLSPHGRRTEFDFFDTITCDGCGKRYLIKQWLKDFLVEVKPNH